MARPLCFAVCVLVCLAVVSGARTIPALKHNGVAATYAPLTADGSALNLTAIDAMFDYLERNNVQTILLSGTIGESLSLTAAERMQLADYWINLKKQRRSDIPIWVHVGAESLNDALAMAAHARDIGADAILLMGPIFFKPESLSDLVEWCARVAAAAPSLPLYYYHYPQMTGLDYQMIDFLTASQGRLPTLAGVKYAAEDLNDMGLAAHFQQNSTQPGPYSMLIGDEDVLLPALTMGASGSVLISLNFMAPAVYRLLKYYGDGNLSMAQFEQTRIQNALRIIEPFDFMGGGKAILAMKGIFFGSPRFPNLGLSSQQCDQLRAQLDAIGFFQWS